MPKLVFHGINSIIVGLLWGSHPPRLSFIAVLKLPIAMVGLALLDLRSYYFVSQLTFLHWRLFPKIPNATIVLEAVVAMSLKTLLCSIGV